MTADGGGEDHPAHRIPWRPIAVIGSIVIGCLVVAVTSSAGPDASGRGNPGAAAERVALGQLGAVVAFTVFTVMIAAAVLVLLRGVAGADARRAEDADDPAAGSVPPWLAKLITGLQIAFGIFVATFVYKAFLNLHLGPSGGLGSAGDGGAADAGAAAGAATESVLSDLVSVVILLAALTVLVGAGILLVLMVRRRGDVTDEVVEEPGEGPLAWGPVTPDPFAFDPASFAAGEPRPAIIAMFDRAATMLRARGVGAAWGETSAEHIARVGPSLPGRSPAAARVLLSAYHEAKFSTHPLTETRRRDAIASLATLRADLVGVHHLDPRAPQATP